MSSTFCVQRADGVVLHVRVIPRGRKTEVAGIRDEALLVRLAAPPVGGAANDALVEFLARRLGLPRRAISLLDGEHSRRKRVAIEGVTSDLVRDRLLGAR